MGKRKFLLENPKSILAQLGADVRTLGHWSQLPALVVVPISVSSRQGNRLVAIDTRLDRLTRAFGLRLIWLEEPAARRMGLPRATYILRCIKSNSEIRKLKRDDYWTWRDYNMHGLDAGLPLDREVGLVTAGGERSVVALPEEFRVCGAVTGYFKTIHRSGPALAHYLQAVDPAPFRMSLDAGTFAELRDKVSAVARVYSSIEEPSDLVSRGKAFLTRLTPRGRREYRDALRLARAKGLTPRELAAVGGGR